ncbi:MAG: hypothetical protein HC890_18145 [Chloroflexaceae bacterium]|nr:hypothetical protein [Chloroflexaceae bacterium]
MSYSPNGATVESDVFREAFFRAAATVSAAAHIAETLETAIFQAVHPFLEAGTRQTGKTLASAANNDVLRFVIDRLGVDWLRIVVGEADLEKIRGNVRQLRQKFPGESAQSLSHRLLLEKMLYAGGLGIAANLIPPVAIALLGVELAALAKLEAEMVYQLAEVYGLDLSDPARRGEVLGVLLVALMTSGFFKGGIGLIVEMIPLIGTVYGATINVTTLGALGSATNRYYDNKVSLAR